MVPCLLISNVLEAFANPANPLMHGNLVKDIDVKFVVHVKAYSVLISIIQPKLINASNYMLWI